MELGLSLGEAPARPPPYAAKKPAGMGPGLGFCMVLGVGLGGQEQRGLQLDLRPPGPVSRHPSSQMEFSWTRDALNLEESAERRVDVNRVPLAEGEEAEASPDSNEMGGEEEAAERASPRASDEEENGLARKKLRLSKEQSAFLEESFKEHTTLNPKQKLALAKQLNLRPRQVEVWFQNRRARTKLKQTEVDCEYLKRCCETLTEENRRLQRELADLRALKTAHPLCEQLPATTLSICPSCERASASALSDHINKPSSFAALFGKPRFFPFGRHPAPHHQPYAAS